MTWVQSLEPTVEGKSQLRQAVLRPPTHCEMPMLPTLTYHNISKYRPNNVSKEVPASSLTTAHSQESPCEDKEKRHGEKTSPSELGMVRH